MSFALMQVGIGKNECDIWTGKLTVYGKGIYPNICIGVESIEFGQWHKVQAEARSFAIVLFKYNFN